MAHRILVVDDETSVQQLLRDFLEGQGYAVICAGDGDEAIRKLDSDEPQLAILDFLLPRKNGFAVAEAVRQHGACGQMPLIMMSGVFKNPKTAVEAREKYQVIEFLAKPIDLERLQSLIEGALGGTGSPLSLPLGDDSLDLGLDDPLIDAAYARNEAPGLELEPVAAQFPNDDINAYDSNRSSGLELDLDAGGSGLELDLGNRGSFQPEPVAPSLSARPSRSAHPSRSAQPSQTAPPPVAAPQTFGGRPFPPIESGGKLEDCPVALLISTARYDRLTGMLDTTCEGTHRRVYIRDGRPIFMQSNAEGENVGALLLRRGRITDPDFQRCLDYMKKQKRTMQRALLELHLATEQELATAYKLLAGQLLPAAIGMPNGTFKWRETDAFVGRVPEGKFEPTSMLFDGIKRHVHPPQILKFFVGREDVPLVKTPDYGELLPFFRRAFSANNILAQVDGHATYREITRSRPHDTATVVPQLYALVTSGMTALPSITADNAMDVAVNEAAAQVAGLADGGLRFDDDSLQLQFEDERSGGGGDFTDQEKTARAAIRAGYNKIMSQTFFEILGMQPTKDVDETAIKRTYFNLAKKWHTDAFSGLRLGPEEKLLHDLFARVTDAYDTVVDPNKCAEYLVYVERKAKGLPTDVAAVFEAEKLFDQGVAALRGKDPARARELFLEAIRLNASEAIFIAHLGWVTYLLDRKSQATVTEAVNTLRRAVEMQPKLPSAYQFLGLISMHRGQDGQAKQWFRKCLECDPENIEASRSIRLIVSRAEKSKEKNSGLLSRFLSTKK